MTTTFKIKKEVKDLDQLADFLKKHLDPKFKISTTKAGNVMKQMITGNTIDSVNVVKNTYNGFMLTLGPWDPQLGYQVIGILGYTPNAVLDTVSRRSGILGDMIFRLIFGNGQELYDAVEAKIVSEFDGKPVDAGLTKQAKAMFKGKTVYDEDEDEKGKAESK